MIELNVATYCHSCPDFEPVAHQDYYIDNSLAYTGVTCRYNDRCRAIFEHIREDIRTKEEAE